MRCAFGIHVDECIHRVVLSPFKSILKKIGMCESFSAFSPNLPLLYSNTSSFIPHLLFLFFYKINLIQMDLLSMKLLKILITMPIESCDNSCVNPIIVMKALVVELVDKNHESALSNFDTR